MRRVIESMSEPAMEVMMRIGWLGKSGINAYGCCPVVVRSVGDSILAVDTSVLSPLHHLTIYAVIHILSTKWINQGLVIVYVKAQEIHTILNLRGHSK